MYYRNSLKIKLTCTTLISFLLGVQGIEYLKKETQVGKTDSLGPCRYDNNISDLPISHTFSALIVMWKFYRDGKNVFTILKNRPDDGGRMQIKDNYGVSELEIKNIKKHDAGRYICKTGASNNLSIDVEIDLIVKFKPEIHLRYNESVNEGETIEIWCDATGIPNPNIEWSRRSEEIGISGHMLRIHNVTRYAKDIFMCSASNTEGHDEEMINLNVSFPAEVEVLEKELQRLNTDTDVEMVCAVTANPMVNIVWYKGDKEIPVKEEPFKYVVDTQDDMKEEYYTRFSILKIISTLDEADFDTYYCKAQNDSGHVVATETITLVKHLGE
ncbi:hypothetical protein CHS0354_024852 [Potamilus streckersoni]|uniref:Ig-like domain-containing protein n=1 Tax=Potamilus streckersoni TaxID=2493646 RepID=A0AAE0RQF1_9BIVA|nr:hypothetical protein CHS0354_024852 [Potamilus streckersoni]